jgi:hypothetical protein
MFRSTKLTERKAALQFCRKLEQASDEAVTGRLTESRAHELISEILEHTTGEPLRGFKVRDWFEQWLEIKEKVRAGKTLDRYRQVIRDFLASLGQRGDLWLHQISSRDILSYRSAITATGKTARTANLSVRVVSAAFNAALRQHITDKNPCTALEKLRRAHRRTRRIHPGASVEAPAGRRRRLEGRNPARVLHRRAPQRRG